MALGGADNTASAVFRLVPTAFGGSGGTSRRSLLSVSQTERAQSIAYSPDISIPASGLGVYSKAEIQSLASGTGRERAIEVYAGDPASGTYTRRTLLIERGNLNSSFGGSLQGRFIRNEELQVRGRPFQADGNTSTDGQFPVNGQFLSRGSYSQSINPPTDRAVISTGQYPVSGGDPVSGQFAYDGEVRVRGDISSDGPYRITGVEFRDGRYEVTVASAPVSSLQVNGSNVNVRGNRLQGEQILVNGANSFTGTYRALNQYTSQSTVSIEGEYGEDGLYRVGDVALQNGSQLVQGYVITDEGLKRLENIWVTGSYNASGQFVVVPASAKLPEAAAPAVSAQDRVEAIMGSGSRKTSSSFFQLNRPAGNLFSAVA